MIYKVFVTLCSSCILLYAWHGESFLLSDGASAVDIRTLVVYKESTTDLQFVCQQQVLSCSTSVFFLIFPRFLLVCHVSSYNQQLSGEGLFSGGASDFILHIWTSHLFFFLLDYCQLPYFCSWALRFLLRCLWLTKLFCSDIWFGEVGKWRGTGSDVKKIIKECWCETSDNTAS